MPEILTKRIVESFDGMSAQLQRAARFLLDHPHEVALMSMRELAKHAQVQPATMTRLAKHLGFDGYDALKSIYTDAIREGEIDFSRRADRQVAAQALSGDQVLAAQLTANLARQMADLQDPALLDQLAAAAQRLSEARAIYCLGLRSSFAVAWHFHYVMSLVRDRVVLIEGSGATGIDLLRHMSADDVLLVVSVAPYTRTTVDIVNHAAARGIPIVAITDGKLAPIARVAERPIIVSTESPSFFHTMAPAFAAVEIIATLVTGRAGANALTALRKTEEQLAAFNTHMSVV